MLKDKNSLISSLVLKISSMESLISQQEKAIRDLLSEKSSTHSLISSKQQEYCEKIAKSFIEKALLNSEKELNPIQHRPEPKIGLHDKEEGKTSKNQPILSSKAKRATKEPSAFLRNPSNCSRKAEQKGSMTNLRQAIWENGRNDPISGKDRRENKENIVPRSLNRPPSQNQRSKWGSKDAKVSSKGASRETSRSPASGKSSEVLTRLNHQAKSSQVFSAYHNSYSSIYSNGKGHGLGQGSRVLLPQTKKSTNNSQLHGSEWENNGEEEISRENSSERGGRAKNEKGFEQFEGRNGKVPQEVYGFPQFFK